MSLYVGAVYGCSWGWTHYKYLSPTPDLTVGCLVPDRGWSRHYVCGPRERRGLLPMFCIRAEREERVMLFVTAIPWGADGGGEMFNVVRHLLFTEKLWLLDFINTLLLHTHRLILLKYF